MPAAKKRNVPAIGSVFTRGYKGQKLTLTVIQSKGGGVAYKLGRDVYRSPSAAAKAIVCAEVNGWVWWKMESC